MSRRTGATLIEVLVAIFVMALGMMALMTLFPLGALRMAQAIQDDRCASLGYNGASIAQVKDVRNDPFVVSAGWSADLFVNPAPAGAFPPLVLPPADPFGPSYPILVDPAGDRMSPGWVGGTPGVLLRRPVSFAPNAPDILKWFAGIDDLEFVLETSTDVNGDGVGDSYQVFPRTSGRDIRYSYACLLHRPKSSDPSVVNLSIVVFSNRPLTLGNNLTLPETVYQNRASFDTTRNVVTITHGGAGGSPPPPAVRAGEWILDATYESRNGNANGSAHAYFYRVVGVSETSPFVTELEVETPLRGFSGQGVFPGTVVVLEGVAEVFERGPGREP